MSIPKWETRDRGVDAPDNSSFLFYDRLAMTRPEPEVPFDSQRSLRAGSRLRTSSRERD